MRVAFRIWLGGSMRHTRRAFLLGLLVLILAASGAVILWPHHGTTLDVASDDPVTIRPADEPAHVGWTAASTTTVAPTTTTAAPRPPTTRASTPKSVTKVASVPSSGMSAFLQCVARYESGSNYASVGGGMYGIIDSTWTNRTLGYSARYGTAHSWQASPAAQDATARDLFARYGSKPWSTRRLCGG